MKVLIPVLILCCGCAIADKSDSFGAGIGLETGGILEYVAPIKFKAFVGFSKTCHDTCGKEAPREAKMVAAPGTDGRPFL